MYKTPRTQPSIVARDELFLGHSVFFTVKEEKNNVFFLVGECFFLQGKKLSTLHRYRNGGLSEKTIPMLEISCLEMQESMFIVFALKDTSFYMILSRFCP